MVGVELGDSARVTRGVLAHLHAQGVGVYSPDTPLDLAPGQVGLFAKHLPDHPVLAIAVNSYSWIEEYEEGYHLVYVQVRCRSDQDFMGEDDLARQCIQAMHRQYRTTWGGLPVQRSVRVSGANLGRDDLGRSERSDNYQLILASNTRPWER